MKSRNDCEEQFKGFLSRLSSSDRVAIVHHKDGDGLCSAIVFSAGLDKVAPNTHYQFLPSTYGIFQSPHSLYRNLQAAECNKIVFLDLNVDQVPGIVKNAEVFAEEIVVIDHHKIYTSLDSDKTTFIKAQFLDSTKEPSQYPNAKLTFDLWSSAADVSAADWVCVVGIAADMGLESWKEFVENVLKRRNLSLEDIKTMKEMIAAVESVAEEKFLDMGMALKSAPDARAFMAGPWKKYLEEFERELAHWEAEFEKHALRYDEIELAILEIAPTFSIRSALSNRISQKNPHLTLVIFDLGRSDRAVFSLRRQDFQVKMNELAEKSVDGIPGGSGGGHVPVAVGSVPKAYAEQWHKNVVRVLSDDYSARHGKN